jgi:hypothetical protein
LLDALADAEPMRAFAAQNLQDKHVQGALEEIGLFHSEWLLLSDVNGRIAALLSNVNGRTSAKGFRFSSVTDAPSTINAL